ncbi:MAG: TolC family protein [Sulfuricurvum sp.]|jgi:outer membrane protein TolC|uniref:TolC family protein n=1 Tax=Sulfuricurvum sp. TaxID=2025608 RepID=UPI0025ECAD83|nr:TolC family protein [Sulfuricurvum sp.]MCI4407170.1 TolC family protein [Sulfuricurvum sp.]
MTLNSISKYLIISSLCFPAHSFAEMVQDANATLPLQQSPETNATVPFISKNKVSLKTAVNEAIDTNYRVKQAKERVEQSQHFIREAYADFLPQVALTGNTQRKKYEGFDNQNYSQSQYNFVVSYNLFSSGKDFATVQKNKILKQQQEEKLKGTLEEEIVKIIDAYFSVVYGKLSLDVNQKNYDKLVKIYEIVKTKRELGAATMGDESSISASVSNAKTAMTNTESAYNNAKDYYEFLTNKKVEEYVPYETGFEINLPSIDEVLEGIQANNTDVNIIKSQIKAKQKEIFINKATDYPTIDLTFTDSRRNRYDYDNHNALPPADGYNTDQLVQLSFNYNLYTGGRTEAKTARLMSEATEGAYNLEYTSKELKWNSQKLYNSVQTNTKTLETLSSEIEASEKMADAYWERFRLSSQDLVTLLQAQRQVNSAELEKLRSEKTRILDYFNLLAKQGKLLEYFGY